MKSDESKGEPQVVAIRKSAMSCVAILPGLGSYDGSSDDSDASTDIEDHPVLYDLAGRPIKKQEEEEISQSTSNSNASNK